MRWIDSARVEAICGLPAAGVSLRQLALPRASREETRRLLAIGADKAREIASVTLARAKENIGLLAP